MLNASVQSINGGVWCARTRCRAVVPCDVLGSDPVEAAWVEVLQHVMQSRDRIVVLCNGYFSQRRADLARGLGLEVEVIEAEWGEDVPSGGLARRLGCDLADEVRAVLVLHAEASTGVTSNIAAVRRALDESFHEALLLVEVAATADVRSLPPDLWGADLAVLGVRGKRVVSGDTPLVVLGERLAGAFREFAAMSPMRMDEVLSDHRLHGQSSDCIAIADGLRRGVAAMGLGIVARHPRIASASMTVVRLPQTVRAREVIELAQAQYDIRFADGLGLLAGQAVRIEHGGAMEPHDCLAVLIALGRALDELGAGVDTEAGLAEAMVRLGIEDRSCSDAYRIAAE